MKKIKFKKDIKELKFGEQYTIDIEIPNPPTSEKEDLAKLDEALAKRNALQTAIEAHFKEII